MWRAANVVRLASNPLPTLGNAFNASSTLLPSLYMYGACVVRVWFVYGACIMRGGIGLNGFMWGLKW